MADSFSLEIKHPRHNKKAALGGLTGAALTAVWQAAPQRPPGLWDSRHVVAEAAEVSPPALPTTDRQ